MPTTILEYNHDAIPIELRANPYHPSADKYIEQIRHIQQAIVLVSGKMTPKTVHIVKRYHTGEAKSHIVREMSSTLSFVSKTLVSPIAKKLLALLCFYQEALDGPKEAQRRAMLWRIAAVSEDKAPKTAITAITELNRMDDAGRQLSSQNTAIQITINQEILPKTELDA